MIEDRKGNLAENRRVERELEDGAGGTERLLQDESNQ